MDDWEQKGGDWGSESRLEVYYLFTVHLFALFQFFAIMYYPFKNLNGGHLGGSVVELRS